MRRSIQLVMVGALLALAAGCRGARVLRAPAAGENWHGVGGLGHFLFDEPGLIWYALALGLVVGAAYLGWLAGAELSAARTVSRTAAGGPRPPSPPPGASTATAAEERSERTSRLLQALARTDLVFDPIEIRTGVIMLFAALRGWQLGRRVDETLSIRPTEDALAALPHVEPAEVPQPPDRPAGADFVRVEFPETPDEHEITLRVCYWRFFPGGGANVREDWLLRRSGSGWRLVRISHPAEPTPPSRVHGLTAEQVREIEEGITPGPDPPTPTN